MLTRKVLGLALAIAFVLMILPGTALSQDRLPEDNGLFSYHTPPRHRPSDSHPLRILAYAVHPIGWLGRELVTRPLNYFVASSKETRSIFGYREPHDYRRPECFSADSSVPDCRSLPPYNYDSVGISEPIIIDAPAAVVQRDVYFPDVNFDFDKATLTDLGQGRVRQIARLLNESSGLNIVLEGHTDYVGSDGYNEKLGMNRAETVRQTLLQLGVSPQQLSTVTFGKSKPVFGEQENWARAVNRRVEVHVDAVAPVE